MSCDRLHKVSGTIRGTDNRTARVAPSQKLEGKANAKVIGRTSLQSKSKVAPSQKVEEKFNAREGGRTNLLSKSKVGWSDIFLIHIIAVYLSAPAMNIRSKLVND